MSQYAIRETDLSGAAAYRLVDSATGASALVCPELGANCLEFATTPDGGKPVDVLVPPADPQTLRESPFHRGLPILFPFPNRVRNGVYTFQGKTYRMDRLMSLHRDKQAGQAIHGLVADKPWTVDDAGAASDAASIRLHLRLDAWADVFEQYPFPCTLQVTYSLASGVLRHNVRVENTGTGALPMGYGIHPWFPAALRPGFHLPEDLLKIRPSDRQRAEVRVPAAAIWELENLMPTGRVIGVDQAGPKFNLEKRQPLDGETYDNVFTRVQRGPDGWTEAGLRDPQSGLQMWIAANAGFREWVLYAPSDPPVVALEPYTCTTDAVNLEPLGIDAGLISLEAGAVWNGEIRIGVRAG